MYSIRLENEFIKNLSPEVKSWLARAVVNMINIDGKLDPNEMPYMHDAVLLVNENERGELLEHAKQRKFMELPNLKDDRGHAAEFLYYFASIIAADDRINIAEAEFFKVLCAKLGFPDFAARDVLKWTQELVELQKTRKDLQKKLMSIKPVFRSVDPSIEVSKKNDA